MIPIQINNALDLKNLFSNEELFHLFKKQIIKDFTLVGIDLKENFIHLNPNELSIYLTQEIQYLTDNQFEKLLNLLYRIDVPETKISNCIKTTTKDQNIYANITFIILKRIWMKIWYQNNY